MGKGRHCKGRGLYISMEDKRKLSRGTGLFVHHRIVSAVKTVDFVSDRMSYILLRGRWCNIIVLNVRKKVIITNTIFMRNWGERIFSNPQLGTAVYIRIVMITVLEQ